MKKLLILIFMMASLSLFAQPWKTITGNGNVKKVSRSISNFTSLSSRGAFNVQINYGNSGSIQLEGDENLLSHIETIVEDGKLIIKTEKNINLESRSKIIVYVSMSKINSLEQSGSGNINGNGSFSHEGKTDIKVSGSGFVKLNAASFKDVSLYVSGSGKIILKNGTANNITASVSGSGNIDCVNLECEIVEAKISGSGNIKVNAKKKINAIISGSGNIYYKSRDVKISSQKSGSGRVIKLS
jgi:hypothetical protein